MNDSMNIAAASLAARQLSLETIASNLANVSTPGFKASRVSFSEMLQRGDSTSSGALDSRPRTGGVAVSSAAKDFVTGAELKRTGLPMDLAISGRGFLEVVQPDGSRAYSRGGSIVINKNALLATPAGQPLAPEINVPSDAVDLIIATDGRVTVTLPGQRTPLEIGRLEMVKFVNPGALEAIGDGLYRATGPSGEAITGRAGEDGLGTLVQGALEQSNVQMSNEMVALMQAQRAYELSARVLQVSDSIAAATNELLRR